MECKFKIFTCQREQCYFRLGYQARSLNSNQMHYIWLSGCYFQIYAFASSFLLLPVLLWCDCPNPVLTKSSRLTETLQLKVLQLTGIILPRKQVQLPLMLAQLCVGVCDGVGSCSLTTCFRWSWNDFSHCALGFSVLVSQTLFGSHMQFCCQESYFCVGAQTNKRLG